MRKPYVFLLTPSLVLLGMTFGQARETGVTNQPVAVAEAVITTGVVDRQPSDNITSVSADVGQVFCWTRITGAEGEIEVEHVWYRGDDEMARITLTIGAANWRTWSSKNIVSDWTGDWRVDVVGPDGTVLDSVSFTVQG
ncbi:MAG: DUF2914 domain-containing protein [Gemmatimonadota bacterium]|nr:DUF2914 domain-containing protein [Candidatus Palauibacterales bacterium]